MLLLGECATVCQHPFVGSLKVRLIDLPLERDPDVRLSLRCRLLLDLVVCTVDSLPKEEMLSLLVELFNFLPRNNSCFAILSDRPWEEPSDSVVASFEEMRMGMLGDAES